ncbi:MAG: hypothetical protein J07HQX50_00388, partial [Haloquadratum sp. J07HQX50]
MTDLPYAQQRNLTIELPLALNQNQRHAVGT